MGIAGRGDSAVAVDSKHPIRVLVKDKMPEILAAATFLSK